MLIIEYHKDGLHVADHETMEIAETFVGRANMPDKTFEIRISQAMILDAFRVLIKRGFVDHKNVKVKFERRIITVHENGRLADWPVGLCDFTENYLMELI